MDSHDQVALGVLQRHRFEFHNPIAQKRVDGIFCAQERLSEKLQLPLQSNGFDKGARKSAARNE